MTYPSCSDDRLRGPNRKPHSTGVAGSDKMNSRSEHECFLLVSAHAFGDNRTSINGRPCHWEFAMPQRQLELKDFADVLAEVDRLHQDGYDKLGAWDLAQTCDHLTYFIVAS